MSAARWSKRRRPSARWMSFLVGPSSSGQLASAPAPRGRPRPAAPPVAPAAGRARGRCRSAGSSASRTARPGGRRGRRSGTSSGRRPRRLPGCGERRGRSDRPRGRFDGTAARMPGPCAAAAQAVASSLGRCSRGGFLAVAATGAAVAAGCGGRRAAEAARVEGRQRVAGVARRQGGTGGNGGGGEALPGALGAAGAGPEAAGACVAAALRSAPPALVWRTSCRPAGGRAVRRAVPSCPSLPRLRAVRGAARVAPATARPIGLAPARRPVSSETAEKVLPSTKAAGVAADGLVSFAATAWTASRPMPVATRPAARTLATFAPIPMPATAAPPPAAPLPKKEPSEAGSGTAPRPLSVARWARWRRSRTAQSLHSRRWARRAPRSELGRRCSLQARERELCLLAREAALELLAESPARAEDEGLDGADGDIEDLGDLGVRAALELAHDERGALVEAEEPEGAADLARARHVAVVGGRPGLGSRRTRPLAAGATSRGSAGGRRCGRS